MVISGETILVADDDPVIGKILKDRLTSVGYRVMLATSGKHALECVDRHDPQTALLDIEMPDIDGIEVLKEIRRRGKRFPVVMITAYGSIDRAVQAMREGAYEFIQKPFRPEHVALVVQKAMEQQRLRTKIEILTEETDKRYSLIVGKSTKMNQVVEAAKKVASSSSTVLLLGESGTGKELFARLIHNWSERKEGAFVAINCVGLSKELLESELFGHERGAFTGAHQLKRGKLELAHSGTVFLDEIGDVSPEIQTKLLRFLQEREFERVGGNQPIKVDVRIIAATNRDLQAAVKEGRFREDLFYRLNVVPIRLPPLRERKEDIPDLARFFSERFAKEAKKSSGEIAPEAMHNFLAYDWPGNVRELANVIERAVVLGQEPIVNVQDAAPHIEAKEAKTPSGTSPFHEAIDECRRNLILQALAQAQGNRAAAAKHLGIERSYLFKLIKSFGIE
jgi:DNA-binding NtrC family response regulator